MGQLRPGWGAARQVPEQDSRQKEPVPPRPRPAHCGGPPGARPGLGSVSRPRTGPGAPLAARRRRRRHAPTARARSRTPARSARPTPPPPRPAPAARVWAGTEGRALRWGRGRAWTIKAEAALRARLHSAAAATLAEGSAAVVVVAAAGRVPARSAPRDPGRASQSAEAKEPRPRPEPDPSECGPATPAWPGPDSGAGIGPRGTSPPGPVLPVRRPRPLTPFFVCPRLQGPLPGRPPPPGRPPGPASPPPLAGPGQKMVQKKTAELQGFHRSFKVRAGLVWWAPRAGLPEWPVGGARSWASALGLPPSPAVRAPTVQADGPRGLRSSLQEPSVGRGALGRVSPANLSQVSSAGWGVSRLQACPQHREVREVLPPERPGRVAGSSPDKHPSQVACRVGVCVDRMTPRHAPPRPKSCFLSEWEVSEGAPRLPSSSLR